MILKNMEKLTIWDLPGKAGKNGNYLESYRGSFLPEMARMAIKRYSKKGDLVLDPFVGCGTTVIESRSLSRNAIGYDINKEGIRIAKKMLSQETLKKSKKSIHLVKIKDSRTMTQKDIQTDGGKKFVDFILTSPPYYNNLPYSKDNEQLGTIEDYSNFLKELNIIWQNCFNVLKKDAFTCIVVGDCRGSMKKRRVNGHHGLIPLHSDIISQCQKIGFYLWDIIIHPIYNMNSLHNFFYMRWLEQNNLQFISHDYILVFRKFDPEKFEYSEKKKTRKK
jgi:DNA modification methylase